MIGYTVLSTAYTAPLGVLKKSQFFLLCSQDHNRKDWLFANTPKGADASAIAYSIVQTAVANKLKPFEYIQFLLKNMPNSNVKDHVILDSFLPWSDTIPDSCKSKVPASH